MRYVNEHLKLRNDVEIKKTAVQGSFQKPYSERIEFTYYLCRDVVTCYVPT